MSNKKLVMDFHIKIEGGPKFDFDQLEFNSLNVAAGENSAGKSFSHKWLWYLSHLLNMYDPLTRISQSNGDSIFKMYAEKAFKWTFIDSDEISGYVMIHNDHLRFGIEIKNSQVTQIMFDVVDPTNYLASDYPRAWYASSNTRQFTSYEGYLKLRKLLNVTEYGSIEDLEKLCESHPLYDVIWYENIRMKLKSFEENGYNPFFERKQVESFLRMIGQDVEFSPDDFRAVDGVLEVNTGTRYKRMSTMSSGFQAGAMLSLFM